MGEVFASDASVKGSMTLARGGMEVMSGSTMKAGAEPALLKLTRGGEVRVCAETQLTLGASTTGRNIMLGMNPGAIEAQYSLETWADTVMTPDFRILVAGPGLAHFALGVEPSGDTCIRTLASNTVSLLVSELLGDGTYQVKSSEQVVFHGGKVATADDALAECGCPAPPANRQAAKPAPAVPPAPQQEPAAPPQGLTDKEVHVEVDAPFVFRASDPEPPVEELLAELRLSRTPGWSDFAVPPPPQPEVQEAKLIVQSTGAAPAKKPHFFGRLRAFFASIFR